MPTKISEFFKSMPKLKSLKDQKSSNLTEQKNCEKLIKMEKCEEFDISIEKIVFIEVKKCEPMDVKKIICEYCGKDFKSKSILVQHKKYFHADKGNYINCNLCDRKFMSKRSLDLHTNKFHFSGEIQHFECDFDGKIFKNKGLLFKHMDVHFPKIECKVCNILVRKANLKNHMITHYGSGNEYQCDFCSKTFRTKSLLKSHQPLHMKKFECEICNKMFSHLRQVRKHKKDLHENPGSFECTICNKNFNTKGGLKSHQITHDKYAVKHLKCQKCIYKTNSNRNFRKHQDVHQRKEEKFAAMKNPLKCEKCFIFCSTPFKLRLHLIKSHPENPFQCDLCGKYLKTKIFLKNHMRICVAKKNQKC